ncbi:hypothetical protein GCM10027275_50510 [Rhabdobacter roseus]|uniref:Uncharacterized protein n=1 Tax=Rhabdobacter roseus TaxID=1655419 RepID=A0A840TV49_9BACT|nr:hypothetical protein [Rhabdobacter roseus]MBB5287124.1 hypothetical protein [Rhabdobacter roseus]
MATYVFQTVDILGVRRGDSFEASFEIGEELDLTGCTARAQLRRYPSDFQKALELDVELDGQLLLLSKAAQSMHLAAATYHYDVEITDPTGLVITLFGGKFEITHDVTR